MTCGVQVPASPLPSITSCPLSESPVTAVSGLGEHLHLAGAASGDAGEARVDPEDRQRATDGREVRMRGPPVSSATTAVGVARSLGAPPRPSANATWDTSTRAWPKNFGSTAKPVIGALTDTAARSSAWIRAVRAKAAGSAIVSV